MQHTLLFAHLCAYPHVQGYEDNLFVAELERVAPQLMLLALFHVSSEDASIRGRAFDLICRRRPSPTPCPMYTCLAFVYSSLQQKIN